MIVTSWRITEVHSHTFSTPEWEAFVRNLDESLDPGNIPAVQAYLQSMQTGVDALESTPGVETIQRTQVTALNILKINDDNLTWEIT